MKFAIADLTRADLAGANLAGAVPTGAVLRSLKADLWMTLTQNRAEVPGLVKALREGRVNGSTYAGECACLVGTIANVRGVRVDTIEHNANNPAERWFLMIAKGDKPGDKDADGKETGGGLASRMALEWTLEYCALSGIDPDKAQDAAL